MVCDKDNYWKKKFYPIILLKSPERSFNFCFNKETFLSMRPRVVNTFVESFIQWFCKGGRNRHLVFGWEVTQVSCLCTLHSNWHVFPSSAHVCTPLKAQRPSRIFGRDCRIRKSRRHWGFLMFALFILEDSLLILWQSQPNMYECLWAF